MIIPFLSRVTCFKKGCGAYAELWQLEPKGIEREIAPACLVIATKWWT